MTALILVTVVIRNAAPPRTISKSREWRRQLTLFFNRPRSRTRRSEPLADGKPLQNFEWRWGLGPLAIGTYASDHPSKIVQSPWVAGLSFVYLEFDQYAFGELLVARVVEVNTVLREIAVDKQIGQGQVPR